MRPKKDALKGKTDEERKLFEEEWLVNEFTEQLAAALVRESISRAELARRAKVTKAYVTKIFHRENVTLRNAARLAFAANQVIDLKMRKRVI